MKKALLVALTIGLIATSAQAATLGYDPALNEGGAMLEVPIGVPVAMPVIVDVAAADSVQTVFFGNAVMATAGSPTAEQVEITIDTPPTAGWVVTDANHGILGAIGQQVQAGDPTPNVQLAPGSHVVALQWVVFTGEPSDIIEISFAHDTVGLLTTTGAAHTFGPNFDGVVPNFFGYGLGAPEVEDAGTGGSVYNPVVVHLIPEPATLSLLALGGLVALRRRR